MLTADHLLPSATWRQVAAFRLSRHHLTKRALKKNLNSVAGDMLGAQAQLISAAQISLWSRVQDLEREHVDRALSGRTLVKAACMRRTLYLVPAEELAVFVRGTARRAEKEIRWALGKGVPGRTVDKVIDTVLGTLDQPLTRTEIAEKVSLALGVQVKTVVGGGWGSRTRVAAVPVGDLVYPVVSLLHMAAARGVTCYGPYRENEPTFVRGDAWLPNWHDLSTEIAEDLLLHKYLRAFAPATAEDFAAWTGLALRETREIWGRNKPDMATVDIEGWEATLLQEDLDVLRQAEFKQPLVCLLPYFDAFLLGHEGRDHLLREKDRPKVYRPQGWIAPVVLVDGRIVAVWKYARQRDRLIVDVEALEPISADIIDRVHEEVDDLSRFLGGGDFDIQFA
jgi:hypothetical protein